MSLSTLGAGLLGNLSTGKRIYRGEKGKRNKQSREGIVKAGYGNNKMDF